MSAQIIDGKAFAANLREKLKEQVEKVKAAGGDTPGLAVVLVGEDPASQVYVRSKHKATIEAGMNSFEHRLPADCSQETLMALIDELNNDPAVHGILCQLPLPKHLNEEMVINAINVEKDVDGFHIQNVGLLTTGQDALIPCTPYGSFKMLQAQYGDLQGLDAVVIGRSNIVGKPMATLLLNAGCTVTSTHSKTKNIEDKVRQADIVVVAVGRPKMVKGDWIKKGATVIDVGINRIEEDGKSKIVGDVDFESAVNVAGAITPVPGGVGPMTIAMLLVNTFEAYCRVNGLDVPKLNG